MTSPKASILPAGSVKARRHREQKTDNRFLQRFVSQLDRQIGTGALERASK